jgi:FlaA1/EpsC-like NDP-sugar epimerase
MPELRNRHLMVLDILLLLLMPAVALSLRLERLDWWPLDGHALVFYTLVALMVKLAVFYCLQVYNRYWRFASVDDLLLLPVATAISSAILAVGFVDAYSFLGQYGLAIYRSVPVIDGLLTCLAVGGLRLCFWEMYHWNFRSNQRIGGRRVLVVGAGKAGILVVREMRGAPQLGMEPVAFVDDDPHKIGTHIQSLPVLGSSADIPKLIERHQIQRIIVALPSVPLIRRREIIALCQQAGVPTENVPGMYEILAGSQTVSRLPKVDINRLLRREPFVGDPTEALACLRGSTVLVTGAGGSIGSELCRQVARLGPKELVLLGHGENSIFETNLELGLSFPALTTHPVIADIRDRERINQVVEKFRPNVIFHAAAHKHVPLMEANAEEAITNNVLGTQNVLQAAEQCGVERFVLISTDKAVNPINMLGVSKRLAELLVTAAAHRSGRAYMAVRFGNVLGSRGSVIPVFLSQIAAGGPVTVTHPDMRRYFMSIPEAVQLVLQATVQGCGGEVFTLDMGEQVRIVDLATDLIKLAGLELERDIKIVYSGVRPGEKMSEELFLETEHYQRTKNDRVFVVTNENYAEAETVARLVNWAIQVRPPAVPQRTNGDKLQHPPLPFIEIAKVGIEAGE